MDARLDIPLSDYDRQEIERAFRALSPEYIAVLAESRDAVHGLTFDERNGFARMNVIMSFSNPMLTRIGLHVCAKARETLEARRAAPPMFPEPKTDDAKARREESERLYAENAARRKAATDAMPFYHTVKRGFGRLEYAIEGGPNGFPRLSYPKSEEEARDLAKLYNTVYAAGFRSAAALLGTFASELREAR